MEEARAIVADGAGNVILTGSFEDTLDLGGGALKSAGGSDIFIAKLDPTGKPLWGKRFGDNGDYQQGNAVAVDKSGNIIVAGQFEGTVNFGGQDLKSSGQGDLFVVKLDPSGKHLWSKSFGDAEDYQLARAVATNSAGDVMIAGDYYGSLNFGSGALTAAGVSDIFVAKLDKDGKLLWGKSFGDDVIQSCKAMDVDGQGNIVLAGEFGGTLSFGGAASVKSAGGRDIFVAKLDGSGSPLWAKRAGDSSTYQYVAALRVDGAGGVLVTGEYESTVNFGGSDLKSAGSRDIYLAKLDASGAHLWSKQLGDSSPQHAYSLAVDGAGSVIIGGTFKGTMDFGGGALSSPNQTYVMYLAKLDGTGKHVWSKKLGDAGDLSPNALATDAAGGVLVTGRFWGSVDFGGGALSATPDGNYDVFVAKLAP